MITLGIETSCDETSIAIVEDGQKILAHVIISQIEIHMQYGGVVPEIASRSHLEAIVPALTAAFNQAFDSTDLADRNNWSKIDAIAVTEGPGLSGGLLIGTLTARALAWVFDKPLYGVNHVLGHTYANFLTDKNLEFPVLSLTASGGHTQLLILNDYFDYKVLGQTQDDAVGEAFDKVAKMLGLGYPGGPSISKAAQTGDSTRFKFPKARLTNRYDFSFSGVKTAVLRELQSVIGETNEYPSFKIAQHLKPENIADVAASFEYTAVSTLIDKLELAIEEYAPKTIVVGGGVAANKQLQRRLSELDQGIAILPTELCTDNAAMVACLGYFQALKKKPTNLNELFVKPSLSL